MLNVQSRKCRRPLFGVAVFGLGVLLLVVVVLSPAGAQESMQSDPLVRLQSMPRSLTFAFDTPDYELVTDDAGLTTIEMEGFFPSTLPGDPNLPAAVYHIALPPLVPLESVRVEIDAVEQTELPGVYHIPPTGPFLPADNAQPIDADWGPNAPTIVDGKNVLVYDQNAYYPAEPVELAGVAHMRKWRIAEVRFWPVRHNPVTGQLWVTTKLTVTLHYDSPALRSGSLDELQDRLMDDRAAEAFLNFDKARSWYDSMMTEQPRAELAQSGYAIITTNQIAAASTVLDDFVSHKQALGYSVQVVTEDQYGSLTAPPPDMRADKVRQWLGDHWMSDDLLYVLLIGNPDPYDPADPAGVVGDMPMKLMSDTPTDFYFADLYSTDPINWDWWADVYVGRIPVYQSDANWVEILDRILQKTINYESTSDTSWRSSVLLPMAFLDLGYDGAKLAELMRDDYLESAGFSTHRLYWHGTLSNSQYSSEEELVDGAVLARWRAQPFGIVTWYGHGNKLATSIYEERGERSSHVGDILKSNETQYLDDTKPALTFQASCQTGWPEEPKNLGYALLRQGAVGTVSGSRDTYGFPGGPAGIDAHSVSLAYNYVKYLTDNRPTGKALYWVKSTPGLYTTNALAYNLYGDPSVQLLGPTRNNPAVGTGTIPSQETANTPTDLQTAAAPDEATRSNSHSANTTGQENTDLQNSGVKTTPDFPAAYSARILANEPDRIVSMGQAHNCAIEPNGDVDCLGEPWGFTIHWGQAISQTGSYVQVSSGLYHTCGLEVDGSVHCWGRQDHGLGTDQPGPYVQISTNYLHICGLEPGGSIDCWGNNDAGQSVDQSGSYVQVSTGMQHTCGLTSDGNADCWGRNAFGQANDRNGPFTQIDTGYFHTCGLKPDGSVDCWGSNHHGQADDQAGPFIQISVGWFHTCGLRPDGSVDCWGKNEYGQAEDQPGPYVRISTNFYNSVGLRANGTLGFWGGWMKEEDQPGPYGQYQPESTRMSYTAQEAGVGMHYTAIHLADMDGDAAPEVLVGNRDTSSLEIWRYDTGPGALVNIDTLEFPSEIHDIKAADFDGDNDVDVVVGLRGWGLYYVTNTGEPGTVGSWSATEINDAYSWQVLVSDFDQDGELDISQGVNNGPIRMFYGDGAGGFVEGTSVQDPATAMRFTAGFNAMDLNGDNRVDLIGPDGSFLRAFLNPGSRTGEWASVGPGDPIAPYPCCDPYALQSSLSPSAGDLDGNGVVDQVAFLGSPGVAGPVEVLLFSGSATGGSLYFDTTVVDSILYPGWAGHAGVADLDGDGYLDVHVGGWGGFNGLRVYYGDGHGGFEAETIQLDYGVGEPNSFAVGDMNGDGVMDIVTNIYSVYHEEYSGFEVLFGKAMRRTFHSYLPYMTR